MHERHHDQPSSRFNSGGFGVTADPVREYIFAPILIDELNAPGMEIAFWQGILARQPDNVDALFELGLVYTRQGDFIKGLETDLRLIRLRPTDEICHYNLACSYSLLGRMDDAFRALHRAVELGYNDLEYMESDHDLERLRADPRYKGLIFRLLSADRRTGAPRYPEVADEAEGL